MSSPVFRKLAEPADLGHAIAVAREELVRRQSARGYWLFELEADCTIPAEYLLMMHFLAEVDQPLEAKMAAYLRARQAEHGGWPLYHGGDFDMSCSVKAYFALKLAGDGPEAPHMRWARAAILERGGAARANLYTRITLAPGGSGLNGGRRSRNPIAIPGTVSVRFPPRRHCSQSCPWNMAPRS
jgi:hypothetical protein